MNKRSFFKKTPKHTGTTIRERESELKTDQGMSTELGKAKRNDPAAILLQVCLFITLHSGCFGLVPPALTGFSPDATGGRKRL